MKKIMTITLCDENGENRQLSSFYDNKIKHISETKQWDYVINQILNCDKIECVNGNFKIGDHGLIPFAKRGETIIREDGAIETPMIDMEVKPFEECSEDELNEFKTYGFVEIK